MSYYCTCKSGKLVTQKRKSKSKKNVNGDMFTYTTYMENKHWKLLPTEVDKDGVCLHCGYYASVSPTNEGYHVENKYKDTKDYHVIRDREIGLAFASQGELNGYRA